MTAAPRRFTVCPLRWAASLALALAAGCVIASAALAQDLTTPLGGEEQAEQPRQLTGEDLQRMLEEGEEALKSEDWESALGTYDQLVRIFRQRLDTQVFLPIVYTGRGRAFGGLEELEAALADFKSALEQEPNHVPALVARGDLYLNAGATDLALADFQKAVENDRRNLEVLFGLGKAYVLLGGAQQAIKPLTYVILQDDQNAEAFRLRSQAYAGVAKYAEAHEDIDASLRLNPDDYETHFALGALYLREEKFAESAQAIEDSIQRYVPKEEGSDEPFAQGYLTKAAVLIELGKTSDDEALKEQAYETALADCDRLLELLGDSPIYASIRSATEFRRGVALRMLGQLGEAINALTEALNINPDLGEAYLRRGICFYHVGENDLAVADFQQAAIIAYDDPRPRLWEGFAQAKAGNLYEAVRAYGQAIAQSDRYVPAYVNRGLTYMMLEDYQKAIEDFHEAIRLEPTVASHYFKRGLAYERLGDYQLAADSFASAIKFDEKHAAAYRHAADALSQLGRGELAGEYRSKAAELEAAASPRQ